MTTYKPNDFAKRIGVSVKTLQRWDNSGVLVAHRTPGNRRFYTREDAEEYYRSKPACHDARWICREGHKYECSTCGAIYNYDDNFCGSCGARMVWDPDERNELRERGEKYV